ncbi:hypothetical protein PHLGIDRAFT_99181 [Phlebiopsis gigantea 11061_1 CR5-6]|uniref:Ras-GEF domain-containing protein n=1 Tax=Phlebiopsis gigantea (strain 11061_1 CR5-6) TaxID=745531 RepID=A0A0C3SDE2_PHLG1|nr:hypothetical protein PHLGIDRAFT_99181 [Phlebiopsis gigantea 11061_1 CR5-6]
MSIDSSLTEPDSPETELFVESPSERSRSFDSSSRRLNKIKQITGDDVAQAVHDGKLAQASCPWYLRPICGEDEIRYDYNGSVAAGTLAALVEALTSEPLHQSLDAKLRHTFFSTFRTMGTSAEVYNLLLRHFHQQQPLGLTGAEADDWRLKRLYPSQCRVLNTFKTWLVAYHMIEDDPPIARQLQEFLPNVTSPAEIATAAEEVMDTLKHLTFALPGDAATMGTPPKRRKNTRDSKRELLRLDPSVLAENLCIYESGLYSKIRRQECLERISARTGDSAANLSAFCSTHDRLASWVKHSILWNDNLGRRADLVDFWIKVAEKCRGLHNYSSMSAIVTALSSSDISRLHLTWAHVNKKAHLEPLVQLNDPSGNFSAFRSVQRTCDLPSVPFIGPYLTDIIHIKDQYIHRDNPVTTARGPALLFNFVKRRKWTDVLDTIFRHQSKQYTFSPTPAVMSQIETQLNVAAGVEQAAFWARSADVQREERASADLRRGLEAAGF